MQNDLQVIALSSDNIKVFWLELSFVPRVYLWQIMFDSNSTPLWEANFKIIQR